MLISFLKLYYMDIHIILLKIKVTGLLLYDTNQRKYVT